MSDTPSRPTHGRDPNDELLGLEQLIAEGFAPEEARAVLGPHTALPRWEARERYELLLRERRMRP
jgi:hypothetical protein